jgi:cold shock CspA family protein
MAQSHDVDPRLTAPRRAIVAKLFADYGFLLAPDCREIRFGRDAVLRDEFDELRVGSEVLYEEVQDPAGPSAMTVDLQSTPYPLPEEGEEPMAAEDEVPEMPEEDLWQEK